MSLHLVVRRIALHLQYDCIDKINNVDRKSYEGPIDVKDGFPRNPKGRTGIIGRGRLRRWGPNHAADPIVTRWKRDEDEQIVKIDGRPVLQFVAVQRKTCGSWALPGGMVDPGDNKTATLIKEFGEEALNTLEASDEEKEMINNKLKTFFENGITIYKGYVDDPRNTDNSWMETKAKNFHDDTGTSVGAFELNAGDDAADCKWMDIDSSLNLYASHTDFLKRTSEIHNAYW
ncbi:ADP catabolic process [Mactra antiquata]